MKIIYSLDELPLKVKKSEIFAWGDKLIKIERLKIQKVSGIPIYKVSLDRNSFEKLKDKQQIKALKIQVNDNKKYAATGSKGYRWLESETVKSINKEDVIDREYYNELINAAVDTISEYGDFEWFVSDDPYISPWQTSEPPWDDVTPFDVR